MSKGSEAIEALLKEAKQRQALVHDLVRAAERTLVKRRATMATVDAEVCELEADLAMLRRRGLSVVA